MGRESSKECGGQRKAFLYKIVLQGIRNNATKQRNFKEFSSTFCTPQSRKLRF